MNFKEKKIIFWKNTRKNEFENLEISSPDIIALQRLNIKECDNHRAR